MHVNLSNFMFCSKSAYMLVILLVCKEETLRPMLLFYPHNVKYQLHTLADWVLFCHRKESNKSVQLLNPNQ
jgi:hypothetical protein